MEEPGIYRDKTSHNPDENAVGTSVTLKDDLFRWLLIPFLGISIPLVTGLVDQNNLGILQVKLSYLYMIAVAFVIYMGNRYLIFTLRSYFNWYNKPLRKIFALLLVVPFFTVPVSVIMLVGYYKLFQPGVIHWEIIRTSSLLILICVIFIVHVYETAFLVVESESEMVKNAQLQQAKAEAELQGLKNQVDPHFIFNSLNTLSYLIKKDADRAITFNDNLADVYRYILQHKERALVVLREELNFLSDYYSLLRIRFGNAVHMENNIPGQFWDCYLLPPISLQLLLENAIKHNEFSDEKPVCLTLSLAANRIVVSNKMQLKTSRRPSSGIGLKNLEERYKLATLQSIEIKQQSGVFAVTLPLIAIS